MCANGDRHRDLSVEERIELFENILKEPAPDYDPEWLVTKSLLETVRVQSEEILRIAEVRDFRNFINGNIGTGLRKVVAETSNVKVRESSLKEEDVNAAIADLNAATDARNQGKEIIACAGSILKFALKVLI